MGKALIIKDVDFALNSFDNINVTLPDGYRKVSKIFNSLTDISMLTSSFDTGIYITPQHSISCYSSYIAQNGDWAGFFGDYVNEQTIVTRIIRNEKDSQFLLWINSLSPIQGNRLTATFDTTKTNKYEIRGQNLYVNDSLIQVQGIAPNQATKTATVKIYIRDVSIDGNFVIKDADNKLVFCGIPCVRESDDYAGIYDIISYRFISNDLKNEYVG